MKRITSIASGIAAAALSTTVIAASALAPATAAPVDTADLDFETSASSRAPAGTVAYGLTFNNVVVKFDVNGPGPINRFGPVSGLAPGEQIIGMDMRPANKRIYVVTDLGGLYILQLRDQSLDPVDTLGVVPEGEEFGVDFNPAADALRIVSDTGQNLRYSFVTRGIVDGPLTEPPNEGIKEGITAAAYTNNDISDETGTTLLDLDLDTDRLLVQAPANNGTLSNAGRLRRQLSVDASFDIFSPLGRGGAAQDNAGYAVATQLGARNLLRVNLLTGATTKLGEFPGGRKVRDFTIQVP